MADDVVAGLSQPRADEVCACLLCDCFGSPLLLVSPAPQNSTRKTFAGRTIPLGGGDVVPYQCPVVRAA